MSLIVNAFDILLKKAGLEDKAREYPVVWLAPLDEINLKHKIIRLNSRLEGTLNARECEALLSGLVGRFGSYSPYLDNFDNPGKLLFQFFNSKVKVKSDTAKNEKNAKDFGDCNEEKTLWVYYPDVFQDVLKQMHHAVNEELILTYDFWNDCPCFILPPSIKSSQYDLYSLTQLLESNRKSRMK